ncbi:MAG: hypothetical protein KY475_15480 [Planctomycetes bacterium]|nr:hypothetical protein [Planctomycetota bacterium]
MAASTIQFVTRTKLAELGRQRDSLLAQYQKAEMEGAHGEPLAGLVALYEALKQIRVGHMPLHRGLPNLAVLLRAAKAPETVVAFWREQLLREIQRGRLRADVVYLFGAFLGEWDNRDAMQQAFRDEAREQHDRLIQQAGSLPDGAPPLKLLERRLAGLAEHVEHVSAQIDQAIEESVSAGSGCYPRLTQIAANPHHPADVRAEARRFNNDEVLSQQLTDALRVATRDPRDWSWSSSGVPARAQWTRNKWRLYPTLSLVDLAILQAHSDFWSGAIENCYSHTGRRMNRQGRLQKLEDLNAPEVITANERRMLKAEVDRILLPWYEPRDPWTSEPVYQEGEPVRGIVYLRAEKQCEVRDASQMGYGYAEGANAMIRQVHAEVRLLRAAFPDRALHVVKLDIRDYFADVPHETLLRMLEGLGMPRSGREFAERFLAVPYLIDGGPAPARRGAPMEQPFSHWLCEWLLRLMEAFVHSRARVRIIRQIDDICLLAGTPDDAAAGWSAVREFLADCGLSINEEKCGAITIGGDAVKGLPAAAPRWGMLELNRDGDWQLHEPTFENLFRDSRREVNRRDAVLAKVSIYNQNLKFLLDSLGVAMDLGDSHRESIGGALSRFERTFFDGGRSVFDGLRDCIRERYQDRFDAIPTSWMVWPITAGGLGLRSATVLGGQYQIAYDERCKVRKPPPRERPDNWQTGHEEWTAFYEDLLVTLEPAECSESQTMKTLVDSFIRRGKAISGGKQEGLTQYWRWVLSVYGPEILDRLGTFEFLLTELVPLQLIQEKLLENDMTEGEG